MVYIIIHSESATIGSTNQWLKDRNVEHVILDASHLSTWPSLTSKDALIIMGGDMEVWDEKENPWLKAEKALIQEGINKGTRIFGICLGAQLLAEALGAKIFPSREWQVGWHPIVLVNKSERFTPFHFHSSMIHFQQASGLTAYDKFCSTQAFEHNRGLRGFQFHTEIDWRRLLTIVQKWEPRAGQVDSRFQLIFKFLIYRRGLRRFYFQQLDEWWRSGQRLAPDHQPVDEFTAALHIDKSVPRT